MKNSEAFLSAFTRIERHLRKATNSKPWVPFAQLVARASHDSAEVRRFRDDLKQFSDLRNAIVHERMHDQVIAEPNEWAIARIATIVELLTAPPSVTPLFAKRVYTIDADLPLYDAVKLMKQHEFSKLPVIRAGNYAGLLTAKNITRWLGASVDGGIVNLRETTASSVLEHTEHGGEVFVKPDTSVFEVYEHFQRVATRGRSLEAVLITESGLSSTHFAGIVTVSDLPRLIPYLDLGTSELKAAAAEC